MSITKVGIVGGGQMGGGIAEVCAKAGVDVIVVEVTDELVERSRVGIAKSLDKALDRGKLDARGKEAALGRLSFSTDLGAFADRELVIEAVVEDIVSRENCSVGSIRSLSPRLSSSQQILLRFPSLG